MQFFTVGVSGFLFVFLTCLPDLEDAQTQTQAPTRIRYAMDEKGTCFRIQSRKQIRDDMKLFKDPKCLGPFTYRKRKLTNLQSGRNETTGKAVGSKKSRRSLPQSSGKTRKIKRTDKVNASSISRNKRKSRSMSKSGQKSKRAAIFAYDAKLKWCYRTNNRTRGFRSPTLRACQMRNQISNRKKHARRTAPASSCEGQILHKTDDPNMCHLISRKADTIALNVPCLNHTKCFMIDKLLCKGFQNGKWKVTDFLRCDMDNKIIRAVETDISQNGNKMCDIIEKPNLGGFEGLASFNTTRSQCLNTYYILDNGACRPILKPDLSRDDVYYLLKELCDQANAKNGNGTKKAKVSGKKSRKAKRAKKRSEYTDCLNHSTTIDECENLKKTSEEEDDNYDYDYDEDSDEDSDEESNEETQTPSTVRTPPSTVRTPPPTVRTPPPTVRTPPPTVRPPPPPTTRRPEVVPATTPAIESDEEIEERPRPTRPVPTHQPERRKSVKLYTYEKYCPIPHMPGKCVDTERYEKLVSEAKLIHLVDPAKTLGLMYGMYNAWQHETIGSAARKLSAVPYMLNEVREDNEKAVKMLLSSLPMLLNNDQCSVLYKAPFREDYLKKSIVACG